MKGWQDDVPKFRQAHKDGDWYYADYLKRQHQIDRVRLILFRIGVVLSCFVLGALIAEAAR